MDMKKKAIIISSTLLVLALGGVTALNVTNPDWRANTIFATMKDKRLAWLKAHEDEIAWRKGIQLVALGVGLACFFCILGAGPLSGIGLLVLCMGLGKLYIGKRAKKNREENTEE